MPAVHEQTAGLPLTLNEQLLDRAIRHRVHLEQYADGVAQQIGRLLVDSEAEVVGKLTARLVRAAQRGGLDRGPATTRRLRKLMVGLGEVIDHRYSRWADANADMLKPLAEAEAKLAKGMVQSTLPVRVEMEVPNPRLLASIVEDRPFEGRVMRRWAQKLAVNERDDIARELQRGLVQGETVEQLVGRVGGANGALAAKRHHARAVTRTFVNHVSSHAREETWKANADVVKMVQIVATLDSRTTPICWTYDGRTYAVGEGPRPPFHYNCRTTPTPVLRSWREMGIPLQELPGGMRAAKGTQIGPVPDKLTYAVFFKRQNGTFQREVLGAARYKLFQAGLEDIRRFTTPRGRLYTLAELYRKFPKEAAAAGLTGASPATATEADDGGSTPAA